MLRSHTLLSLSLLPIADHRFHACVCFSRTMLKKIKRTSICNCTVCAWANYTHNRHWNQINFWTITFFFLSLFPDFISHIFLCRLKWSSIHIAPHNEGFGSPISKRPITWITHTDTDGERERDGEESTKQRNSINLRNGRQPRQFMCIRCHLTRSDLVWSPFKRHSFEWCHQENWTTAECNQRESFQRCLLLFSSLSLSPFLSVCAGIERIKFLIKHLLLLAFACAPTLVFMVVVFVFSTSIIYQTPHLADTSNIRIVWFWPLILLVIFHSNFRLHFTLQNRLNLLSLPQMSRFSSLEIESIR